MATSWFFFDVQGKKQGPITSAQLKALVAGGTITPATRIATEAGQESVAGKIKGLFPTAAPPPVPPQMVNPAPSVYQPPPPAYPPHQQPYQYPPPGHNQPYPQPAYQQPTIQHFSTPVAVHVNQPPPSQALPALVSLLFPGIGQLIQGRVLACGFWIIVVGLSILTCFALVGFLTTPLVVILCVVDAATYNPMKKSRSAFVLALLLVVVGLGLAVMVIAFSGDAINNAREAAQQIHQRNADKQQPNAAPAPEPQPGEE